MELEYVKTLEKRRYEMIKDLWLKGYTIRELSVIFNRHIDDVKQIIQS